MKFLFSFCFLSLVLAVHGQHGYEGDMWHENSSLQKVNSQVQRWQESSNSVQSKNPSDDGDENLIGEAVPPRRQELSNHVESAQSSEDVTEKIVARYTTKKAPESKPKTKKSSFLKTEPKKKKSSYKKLQRQQKKGSYRKIRPKGMKSSHQKIRFSKTRSRGRGTSRKNYGKPAKYRQAAKNSGWRRRQSYQRRPQMKKRCSIYG